MSLLKFECYGREPGGGVQAYEVTTKVTDPEAARQEVMAAVPELRPVLVVIEGGKK